MNSSIQISSPYTSVFKRIRILDSTAFQLPDSFSFVYPGAGGCSHTKRHPRTIKDSHSPVQPPTAKWAEISSIREKTVFDILSVVYNYTISDNQAA